MQFSNTIKYRWQRRLLRTAVVLMTLFLAYRFVFLPSLLHWGATAEEFNAPLPGDNLIVKKDYKNTLAVTVHATPSQIWPWVQQMGLHKGGFYSYTTLENLFGCQLKNANRVHPEWQQRQVGEIEPVCASQEGKPNAGWQLAIVESSKAFVWRGMGGAQWLMGVYIDSVNATTSRLITRQQFAYPRHGTTDWWLEKLWFEWAHCVMQRGMISGIKHRVEKNQTNRSSL
jgi:hypothetical protein